MTVFEKNEYTPEEICDLAEEAFLIVDDSDDLTKWTVTGCEHEKQASGCLGPKSEHFLVCEFDLTDNGTFRKTTEEL